MPRKGLTRDAARTILAIVDQCGGNVSAAARLQGLTRGSFLNQVRAARLALGPIEESIQGHGNFATIEKDVTERVKTLADLVRVCEIDLKEWVIDTWSCKASQQFSVPRAVRAEAGEKWTRASAKPVLSQMFHVSAKLRRKTTEELTIKALQGALLEDIRAAIKAQPPRPKMRYVEGGYLFEFSPFDLHMGKYTWGEETVTDYDVDAAEDLFNASLDFLLARALKLADGKFARVLCVFGNDVSHLDNKRGETTAGTRMDVDTRYVRVYRRICAIHRRAVDILRQVAPVDIKVVSGNHDELTSFHLGELLSAIYETTPHVTIDNSPRKRKYYDYGVNLFGFTHGDVERVTELPLLMARERSDLWHRCQSREWHIGHKHIAEKHTWREQDLISDKGVRVRRLCSLSAHDAWHTEHAYTDRRACEAFVFHKDAGFTDHLSFNVDHFTGKALVPK